MRGHMAEQSTGPRGMGLAPWYQLRHLLAVQLDATHFLPWPKLLLCKMREVAWIEIAGILFPRILVL